MHRNIMVSYDGSQESLKALGEAKQMLSLNPQMTLHIVEVILDDDLEAAAGMTWFGMGDYQMADAAMVGQVREKLHDRKIEKLHESLDAHLADVGNEIIFAVPEQTISIAETLLEYAHENDIDLIVMGCRGLGAIRGVLGSVSYAMLRQSDIPILISK